jgi:hypothetical protein
MRKKRQRLRAWIRRGQSFLPKLPEKGALMILYHKRPASIVLILLLLQYLNIRFFLTWHSGINGPLP